MDLEIPKEEVYQLLNSLASEMFTSIQNSEYQKECRQFLANIRNIGVETLDETSAFYIESDINFDELVEDEQDRQFMGLSLRDDRVFRERFVFPIKGYNNTLLGWIGYDRDSHVKYLYARTALGKKVNVAYNLNNIQHCYDQDEIIGIEGYFHSARLNEVGFKNNIGFLGKRKSDFHNRLMNRFGLKILIPDNDESGKKALKFWLQGLTGKIAVINLRQELVPILDYDDTSEQVIITGEKQATDIDDKLAIDVSRYESFRQLIYQIREDSKSLSFGTQYYSF
jgi:DNA primase